MRIYVNCKDVMMILGCARTNAYKVIKSVNEAAEKRNLMPFPDGKANKYLFAELYGIPEYAIEEVIGG